MAQPLFGAGSQPNGISCVWFSSTALSGESQSLQRNSERKKTNHIRVAVILAVIIYGMAAKTIWDKREHLDGFLNPLNENPFVNTITTEIEITTEERSIVNNGKEDETNVGVRGVERSTDRGVGNQYSVDIHVDERAQAARPMPAALRMRSLTREVAKNETNAEAWLYARVAFLFFIALLITWVSSLS